MRYAVPEHVHVVGKFGSGSPVTIDLYDLATGTAVSLSSDACTQIGSTSVYAWSSANLTAQPSTFTEYLWIMTDGARAIYGKVVIGGYMDTLIADSAATRTDLGNPDQFKADVSNLDVAVSSRSSHTPADVWAAAARTLTAGTKDSEVDQILADTDELQRHQGDWATATGFATENPPSQNLNDYKADLTGLNDLSAAQVRAEADAALAAYDPPTKTELDAAVSDVKGADGDDLKVLSDQLDGVQADLDDPDQFKADVTGLATAAADSALARKMLTNRQELAEGDSANLVTYDDDGTTPLVTQTVTDGGNGPIALPEGAPAKRSGA